MSKDIGIIGIFLGLIIIILGLLFFDIVCFLAAAVFGIVLIIAGYYDYQKGESQDSKGRYCPSCGRSIPFDAKICPYCGKKFEDNLPIDENVRTEKFVGVIEEIQEENKSKRCPSCGYENKPNSKFCKDCGTELNE